MRNLFPLISTLYLLLNSMFVVENCVELYWRCVDKVIFLLVKLQIPNPPYFLFYTYCQAPI